MCTAVHFDSPLCQNIFFKNQHKSQCINLEKGCEGNLDPNTVRTYSPPQIVIILKNYIYFFINRV